MAKFQTIANRAKKLYDLTLRKRADFNKEEEAAAAKHEAQASTGAGRTLRVEYGLNYREFRSRGTIFLLSLAAVERYLKTEARPGFNVCPKCLVKMTRLQTCEGDPEGIRQDSKCPECGDIYGCTKANQSLLRTKYGSSDPKWKPLVKGDPPGFSFGSNHIRSTINLIRGSKDAGEGVLKILIGLDNYLDQQAENWRTERKELIEAGEMAG